MGATLTVLNGKALDHARLARLFQALSDEKRLRILDILRDGEHCVCDLTEALDVGQSLLSHHLKTLREADLVRDRKQGRWVHYALVPGALEELEAVVGELKQAAHTCEPGSSCCG